jgi:hypothetical protein
MRNAPLVTFLIGLWLGGSLLVLGVVGYSFPGVTRALAANDKLAARAGFDPANEAEKKTSVLWVYTGEQNRAYFPGWNWAQLALGLITLLLALWLGPSRAVVATVGVSLAIVLAMNFYLTPEIIRLGRELDFVPRDTPPPGMERFDTLHRAYTALDATKIGLLLIGAILAMRRGS